MSRFSHPIPSAESAHVRSRAGVGQFGHEMSLTAAALVLGFWALALWSYSVLDPAWSTSGALLDNVLHNWGARLGAWVADLSYFALGFSVWWLLAVAASVWCRSALRWLRGQGLSDASVGQRLLFWCALLLLMACSCTLEWARLYGFEGALPGTSGGVLGYMLGMWLMPRVGGDALVLLALGLGLMSLSAVFGFSWARLAEGLGSVLDALVRSGRLRREHQRDAAQGRIAAREREREVRAAHDNPTSAPGITRILSRDFDAIDRADAPAFGAPTGFATLAAHAAEPHGLEPEANLVTEPAAQAETEHMPAAAQPHTAHTAAINSQPVAAPIALPTLDLLNAPSASDGPSVDAETLEMTSRLIEKKLHDFGVQVRVLEAAAGPVVTRYDIEPASGTKGAKVASLARDLARALSLPSVRVIETVPGKSCMALELPNVRRRSIALSSVLDCADFAQASGPLPMGLGQDTSGAPVVVELSKMPHLLVAGTTGSGKSVGLSAMLLSLLYRRRPDELRLLLIDPKMVELAAWEGIPHLLAPVITDMDRAADALAWCVGEMQRRYVRMAAAGVRDIATYNERAAQAAQTPQPSPKPTNEVSGVWGTQPASAAAATPPTPAAATTAAEPLPYIVIVIDEMADLMMSAGKHVEQHIARLAQKARAAGIHLILATQRPTVNVVTGLIKTNVPARIAFAVSSKTDSRIVIDQNGAESLLGQGDMLLVGTAGASAGQAQRVHGAYVADAEIQRVAQHLREQGSPQYVSELLHLPCADTTDPASA